VGVRYEGGVAQHVTEHTAGENPSEAPEGKAHQLRRDSRANVATWRTRLTEDEIARVRLATAGVADRFYGADEW
jgi:hypothetical protein